MADTMLIGLLSDTHGSLDRRVFEHFEDCREIWHAGDFGTVEVATELAAFKPFRGVYGNIDDEQIRQLHPLDEHFEFNGVRVYMTHIAGSPGEYSRRVRQAIRQHVPDLLICGHTHLPCAFRSRRFGLTHVNPGAAGNEGAHAMRTMMKLTIDRRGLQRIQLVELGPRELREGRNTP